MTESATFFTPASSPRTPVAAAQILDDNTALNQFLDADQQKLLNLIDDVRHSSVDEYVEPPQIIVCGAQSCGKSSVLEGISGQNFPRGEGLCTTFATELVLRRAEPKIAVNVVSADPDAGMKKFGKTCDTSGNLERLISSAKSNFQDVHKVPKRSFFKDTLRVEISNPSWPPLTLVDLPALIQSANEDQPEEDVDAVQDLVRKYMCQKRTIILAILSAESHPVNQGVLRMAKEMDPQGERTMGIITKPDKLERGSGTETDYLRCAGNKHSEYNFKLGWYVVRNRDHGEEDYTLEERNRKEDEFFADSIWKRELGNNQLGINSVRIQLSKVLGERIRAALPMVINDMNDRLRNCKDEIQGLGGHRSTLSEQETYLLEISNRFQELVRQAVSNDCDTDRFFNEDSKHIAERNLRSFIEQSNEHFRDVMYNRGHKWAVLSDTPRYLAWPVKTGTEIHGFQSIDAPERILQAEYIQKVEKEMAKRKDRQLPRTFDPRIANPLFREQCSRWRGIARAHIEYVFTAAARLLLDAVADACKKNENTASLLSKHLINNILERRWDVLELKLDEILMPYEKLQAATSHPYFSRSSAAYRWGMVNSLRKELDEYDRNLNVFGSEYGVTAHLQNIISSAERKTEFASTASEVLELVHDYYEVALVNFVENVVNLVVESSLMYGLEKEFTPMTVHKMATENEELLALLTSESPDVSQRLAELTRKAEELSEALKICLDARGPAAIPIVPRHASTNFHHQSDPFVMASPHRRAEDRLDEGDVHEETVGGISIHSPAHSSHSTSSSSSNCTHLTVPSIGTESGGRSDISNVKIHQTPSSASLLDAGNTERADCSAHLLSSSAGNFEREQSPTPNPKSRVTGQPRRRLRLSMAREAGLCSPSPAPVRPSEESEEEL